MSNAELIAAARESLAQHDRVWANTSNQPLPQVGVSAHLRKIIPVLESAQAVIAEVDEYLDAIQKPDYLSLQFAINGISETLDKSPADAMRAVKEAAWDDCLDAIEEHELNTEQARSGNPYRASTEQTGAER